MGPLAPRLTTWADALARYSSTKSEKPTLRDDLTRLRWWQEFLEGQGCPYLQTLSPEHIDAGRRALTPGRTPQTVKHSLPRPQIDPLPGRPPP